jgi:serine/threonine protein kinase
VHCDIKPSNVGFDKANNVFVFDVEGAVHLDCTARGLRYTRGYAPPELLTTGPNDTTDFYAFGIMLQEMMVSFD